MEKSVPANYREGTKNEESKDDLQEEYVNWKH
jgi:hypothetical protein